MMQAEARLFHGIGDSHGLEIATVVDTAGFAIDKGVVRSCDEVSNWSTTYLTSGLLELHSIVIVLSE